MITLAERPNCIGRFMPSIMDNLRYSQISGWTGRQFQNTFHHAKKSSRQKQDVSTLKLARCRRPRDAQLFEYSSQLLC